MLFGLVSHIKTCDNLDGPRGLYKWVVQILE